MTIEAKKTKIEEGWVPRTANSMVEGPEMVTGESDKTEDRGWIREKRLRSGPAPREKSRWKNRMRIGPKEAKADEAKKKQMEFKF